MVLIEGEAGIGKSRILHEVRRRTRFQRTKLLLFQCLPGDTLSTLHPLLQNVRGDLAGNEEPLSAAAVAEVFGDHDVHDVDVIDIFSFLLGAAGANPRLKEIDPEAIHEKANWAVRRSLEALCASGPIVLVVEDIQWIDLTSRQLLAELAQHVHHCPALLIATARPGYGGLAEGPQPHEPRIEAAQPRGNAAGDHGHVAARQSIHVAGTARRGGARDRRCPAVHRRDLPVDGRECRLGDRPAGADRYAQSCLRVRKRDRGAA